MRAHFQGPDRFDDRRCGARGFGLRPKTETTTENTMVTDMNTTDATMDGTMTDNMTAVDGAMDGGDMMANDTDVDDTTMTTNTTTTTNAM